MSPFVLPSPVLGDIISDAFRQSDTLGKLIVLVLAGVSLYVLGVVVNKFLSLRGFKSYNAIFLAAYRKHPHPTFLALDPRGLISASPVSAVYIVGVNELLRRLHAHGVSDESLRAWEVGQTLPVLDETEIESIRSACERSLAQQQLVLEAHMSRISTSIAVAPSVGLFGTVWGVMGAFMAMSSGGTAMISAVAPGISGALLTTVAGLAVAIPSIVFYNILSGIIRRHVVTLENFEDMFLTEIASLHAAPESARPQSGAASAPDPRALAEAVVAELLRTRGAVPGIAPASPAPPASPTPAPAAPLFGGQP